MKEKTDLQLVKLSLQEGENFGLIVDRYSDPLFRYLRRISYFSPEDIEDMLQEVFIKVYKNLNSFDQAMKFSTWIYQITRNQMIDEIRKKKARPDELKLLDDEWLKMFRSGIDLGKQLETKEELERVKKLMEQLPFQYKEVLMLRFLEEKSYEEIVDIVKKPKGTVAALINRGRKMVKELVDRKS